MNNKYTVVVISTIIASLVGFFGSQLYTVLTIPQKIDNIEYRLQQIEGGLGTIESTTNMTGTELNALIRILREKDVIK